MGKHQSDSWESEGNGPTQSQSLKPLETTQTHRPGLCFCLLSRGQDAGWGKWDSRGWGKLYPREQGNCLAASGRGCRNNGCCRGQGWGGVGYTPCTGISAASPFSPQAMPICTALPPLKNRVSGCKRKSSTLALSKQKVSLSLPGSISPQGTEDPLHFTSVCYLHGCSCLWCSRLGIDAWGSALTPLRGEIPNPTLQFLHQSHLLHTLTDLQLPTLPPPSAQISLCTLSLPPQGAGLVPLGMLPFLPV